MITFRDMDSDAAEDGNGTCAPAGAARCNATLQEREQGLHEYEVRAR